MRFSDIAGKTGVFVDGDWIEKKDQDAFGEVRLIQLADIGAGTFRNKSDKHLTIDKAIELNCTFLQKGDILIARLGDPLCKACIFPYEGLYITAVDVAVLRIGCETVHPRFLLYLLNSPWFKEQVKRYESGTTRKRISRKNLDRIEIGFPPAQEQARIVSRIEELFSELDNGVETLKKTKQQLAVYRQAVLKEAFDYKKKGRASEFSELVDDIRIGPFGTMLHKSDYIKAGIPVINPQHIKKGKVVFSPSVTVSRQKAEELSSYILKANDIIMGRRGEMGRAAAITESEQGWLCGTGSILFRLKTEYDAGLYAQILSSPDVVHYLEEHATGTTMKNLNESIVKHIPVPVITTEEQKQMTEKMEEQISVCDSIEHTIDEALQQAEAMRQSILKKAFEGTEQNGSIR